MAIWLGMDGGVRLKRAASAEDVYANIEPGDIDVDARRFSVEQTNGALITGDFVSIRRVDEDGQDVTDDLDFIAASGWPDGNKYPDGEWYVNVDLIGGVRLYESWGEALHGGSRNAVELEAITEGMRLRIQWLELPERCLGQTITWELNTDREVADITNLGEGFRRNKAILVSGSGNLECLFDAAVDEDGHDADWEQSVYLHQLVLRQQVGSQFVGVFILKQAGGLPIGLAEKHRQRELFYTCECLITSVVSAVQPGDLLKSNVNFVTTGPIQLLYDYPANYLLQETTTANDKVLQESDFGVLLEVTDD